jgi:hypothetical protein
MLLKDLFTLAINPPGKWIEWPLGLTWQMVGDTLVIQGTDANYDPATGYGHYSLKDLIADVMLWPGAKGFPHGVARMRSLIEEIVESYKPARAIAWSLGGTCAQMALDCGVPEIVTFGAPRAWPRWKPMPAGAKALNVVLRQDSFIDLYPSILYRRPGTEIILGEGKRTWFAHDQARYAEELARLGI